MLSVACSLVMAACAGRPSRSSTEESAGPAGYTVAYDPSARWHATGFRVRKDSRYRIEAAALPDDRRRPYADKGIPCSPDGPTTFRGRVFDWVARDARCPLHPVGWFRRDRVKRLRVLEDRFGRRAHFLTVIGCIGRMPEHELEQHAFIIGSGRDFVAPATGELWVFSNDWPGDESLPADDRPYLNNTGRIEVRITQL